jgi:hypothetical protein
VDFAVRKLVIARRCESGPDVRALQHALYQAAKADPGRRAAKCGGMPGRDDSNSVRNSSSRCSKARSLVQWCCKRVPRPVPPPASPALAAKPRPGRQKADLVLTDDEREQLTRWSRRASSAQALALRSRIVLACAQPGAVNKQVAARTEHGQ